MGSGRLHRSGKLPVPLAASLKGLEDGGAGWNSAAQHLHSRSGFIHTPYVHMHLEKAEITATRNILKGECG